MLYWNVPEWMLYWLDLNHVVLHCFAVVILAPTVCNWGAVVVFSSTVWSSWIRSNTSTAWMNWQSSSRWSTSTSPSVWCSKCLWLQDGDNEPQLQVAAGGVKDNSCKSARECHRWWDLSKCDIRLSLKFLKIKMFNSRIYCVSWGCTNVNSFSDLTKRGLKLEGKGKVHGLLFSMWPNFSFSTSSCNTTLCVRRMEQEKRHQEQQHSVPQEPIKRSDRY